MTNTQHKYLDLDGLRKLIDLIKNGDNTLRDRIRSIEQNLEEIDISADNIRYDDTTVADVLDALYDADNSDSIASIAADKASSAVAEIINGASSSFDTLKEIADWILAHQSNETAATLVTDVEGLKTKVGNDTVANQITSGISGIAENTESGNNGGVSVSVTTKSGSVQGVTVAVTADTMKTTLGLGSAAYVSTDAFDASGVAATAKSEVIGADTDAKTANTIYGAKAYAKDAVVTAIANLKAYAMVDAVTVNGQQATISEGASSVTINGSQISMQNDDETQSTVTIQDEVNSKVNKDAFITEEELLTIWNTPNTGSEEGA